MSNKSSIRSYVEGGKMGKSSINCVPTYNTLSSIEVYDYYNNCYRKELSANEAINTSCKHEYFDDNGVCRTCKRGAVQIAQEESLFNIFIVKKLAKDKVIAISSLLGEPALYLRFEAYLDKLKK